MNGTDLRGRYAEHLWSWDWLGTPIGVHPAIRPGDSDGWLHQSGELLHLEGKVTESTVAELSPPQLRAVQEAGNLTIVLLHTDHAHWVDNRPQRLRGYRVYPSKSFPWEWGTRYVALPLAMRAEDTLRAGANLIVGWSWWAGTRHPWKENT